jgi:Ca2+-binding RTX toxin-like protein
MTTVTDALANLPLVQINGDPAVLFSGGETVVFVVNLPMDSSFALTSEAQGVIIEANALEAAASAAGRPIDIVIVPLLQGSGLFGASDEAAQAIADQVSPGIRILQLDSEELYQADPNSPDPNNPDIIPTATGLAVEAFKQAYTDQTGQFYGELNATGLVTFYLPPSATDADIVQYAHDWSPFQVTLDNTAFEAALTPGGAIDLPEGRVPPANLVTALGAYDEVGEFLPNLSFVDADGASVSLLGQTDGLVVLSICTEWCPPCMDYSTAVGGIAAQVGDGFTFLELMVQNVEGGPARTIDADEWRTTFNLDETVMTPNGDLSLYANFITGIKLEALPTYIVYDGATGEIFGKFSGFGGADVFIDQIYEASAGFSGEVIKGGAAADNLNGTRFSDTMSGLDGNDSLAGGFGNDKLDGGAGLDQLTGGSGDDTYVISDGRLDQKTIVEAENGGADMIEIAGTQQNIRIGNSLPANVERLVIDPRSKLVDFFTDNARAANADFTISADATTLSRIGSFTGGKLNDVFHVDLRLIGDDPVTSHITINGGAGNDTITVTSEGWGFTLDGGAGADNLTGSFGDDTYVIDNAGDKILEDDGEGIQWTQADADDVWAFYGINEFGEPTQNIDQPFIGDSDLAGKSLNEIATIFYEAYWEGNSVIDEAGNVTYPAPLSGGHDLVLSSVSFDLASAPDIEDLTLTGTARINGSGNDLGNTMIGNSSGNVLDGRAGDDNLQGRDGADRLVGGAGLDTMNGAAGDDVFVFSAIDQTGATLGDCDVIDGFGRAGATGRDMIDLSGVPGAFAFIGTAAFAANATNQVRYQVVDTNGDGNTDSTLVMLDNDTDVDVDAAILLRGYVGNLTASDFLL